MLLSQDAYLALALTSTFSIEHPGEDRFRSRRHGLDRAGLTERHRGAGFPSLAHQPRGWSAGAGVREEGEAARDEDIKSSC